MGYSWTSQGPNQRTKQALDCFMANMLGLHLRKSSNANVLVNLRDFPLIGIVWHGNIMTFVSSISRIW